MLLLHAGVISKQIKAIKRRCHPKHDLLPELVPLAHYGGSDFVEQICDITLDLRSGQPDDDMHLGEAMRKLEAVVRAYDHQLWRWMRYA